MDDGAHRADRPDPVLGLLQLVVFAQELVPGRVGMIAGIFFGFAFGMGGIAAAVLGVVADMKGIDFVYQICSYLPLLGLLTVFLPNMKEARKV